MPGIWLSDTSDRGSQGNPSQDQQGLPAQNHSAGRGSQTPPTATYGVWFYSELNEGSLIPRAMAIYLIPRSMVLTPEASRFFQATARGSQLSFSTADPEGGVIARAVGDRSGSWWGEVESHMQTAERNSDLDTQSRIWRAVGSRCLSDLETHQVCRTKDELRQLSGYEVIADPPNLYDPATDASNVNGTPTRDTQNVEEQVNGVNGL